MESDIHYDAIRSLLMQCTIACDLSSTHAAGERRPGTVGQPLPGVSVKVAPLPADADEATDSDVVEGGSLSSRTSGCTCIPYSLAGTVSTFLVDTSQVNFLGVYSNDCLLVYFQNVQMHIQSCDDVLCAVLVQPECYACLELQHSAPKKGILSYCEYSVNNNKMMEKIVRSTS